MSDARGRAAFFGPVTPTAAPATGEHGRRALFSAAPRRKGTIVIECSRCEARSPVPLVDLAPRLLPSVWIPTRSFSRRLRCPACHESTWCRVHWRTVLG